MTLSRKRFLQLVGTTTLGNTIQLPETVPAALRSARYGRTLSAAQLYTEPSMSSKAQAMIWGNSIIELTSTENNLWYRTVGGYVQRSDVQPMLGPPGSLNETPLIRIGDYVYVAATSASLHPYCDIHSVPSAHVGHGGIVRVIDQLDHPDTGTWLAVKAEMGTAIHWTQATQWRVLRPKSGYSRQTVHTELNRASHTLTLSGFTTQVNIPPDLAAGRYESDRVFPGATVEAQSGKTYTGVPSMIQFGDAPWVIHGVHWHNQFGGQASHIEVNTAIAHHIYKFDKIILHVT